MTCSALGSIKRSDAVIGLLQLAGDASRLVAGARQGDEVGLGITDDQGAAAEGHDGLGAVRWVS